MTEKEPTRDAASVEAVSMSALALSGHGYPSDYHPLFFACRQPVGRLKPTRPWPLAGADARPTAA